MLPVVSPVLYRPQTPLTATFSPIKAEQEAVNQGWASFCSRNLNSCLSPSAGGVSELSSSSFPPPGHFFDMRLRHRLHDLREISEDV